MDGDEKEKERGEMEICQPHALAPVASVSLCQPHWAGGPGACMWPVPQWWEWAVVVGEFCLSLTPSPYFKRLPAALPTPSSPLLPIHFGDILI